MLRILVSVAFLLWSPALSAGDNSPYFRFLIPLYTSPVPGAFGSQWAVDNWYYYSGSEPVEMVPSPAICRALCEGPGEFVPLQSAPLPIEPAHGHESGVLIHVPRERASEFAFGSRVRDLSRGFESDGTEVPVVPEGDFRAGKVHLLNVPVGLAKRTTLRIYALPETPAPEVEVRYYRMPKITPGGTIDTNEIILLRTERVALQTYPATRGFLLHPSYATIGNVDVLPDLSGATAVWIEAVPLTDGLRIWAFASSTNNATQQVTLTTPSRK